MRVRGATRFATLFGLALVITPLDGANALPACRPGLSLSPSDAEALADAGCTLTGRVITLNAARLHVPPPGNQVTVHALTTTGEQSISVRVDENGRVSVTAEDATTRMTSRHAPAATVPPPEECFSSAYQQKSGDRLPQDRVLNWFYNGAGEPRAGFYMAVWLGADNMTYGVNDCGLATAVFGISHVASPGSVLRADIDSNAMCAFFDDDLNVVDWGELPAGTLGVSCSWTINTVPCILANQCFTASDVRFNSTARWFVADEVPEPGVEPLCLVANSSTTFGGYDLMGVSAHEFGHVWGLGHVSESTDPRMTMSTATGVCDFSERFIGLGDYVGMCERWCVPQPPGMRHGDV